ncbi:MULTISPECIES: helix-turn-helix domain-containing protein [unclassified Paracoccus (in: a-proteobacteria)]|uniref:helix-turn-helix domain-containing protein n=1 Tax=unclassified Paracoccus (in: a-proteobacteria) TaxID=2688777 RepID=UPI0015FF64BC|nr:MULTISPECIES: helix-turn-helix transcriptional regulator [unclassified Paracoccus (in: a-proteobacteria)]MBB1492844.1 helix-turn-helix transcriptional regulator [Paracoccus sp. MC1854]MBB1499166.1 helix-turn-helix transcriptional regulator [Paracoccus sp. MC1862]QQO45801.1 helix-turn-helix transcriptional regulator [Paracoccus sp. MC1862]
MTLNGNKLRALRAQKGLSQKELAQMSAVNPKTIYRAEKGSPVDQETAEFIAEALGVSARLLRGDDAPARSDALGEVIHLPCRSGRRLVEKMTGVYNFTFEVDVEPSGANIDAIGAFEELLKHILRDPRNAEVQTEGRQTDLRLAAKAQDTIAALAEHGLNAYLGVYSSGSVAQIG